MEIDTFEKLLLVELNESITNESSLWKKSNLGIIRNDGLELFVKTDDIEISKPNEYVFKNSNYKKSLYKIAKKLYEELLDKWETELFEKIMESLKEPYDWKRSIWGITQKTGGIELKMRSYIKEVSVYNPSHEFKNSSYAKTIKKAAYEVLAYIEEKEKIAKEQESREKLSKFFKFDDRKHKLKILQIIAEEKQAQEIEESQIVHKKMNFFQKLFNL